MFQKFIAWVKDAAGHLFSALGDAAAETAKDAAPAFDALVHKYVPLAIEQVKAAATNPDLLTGSQKRGQVINGLKEQLQIDGHDVMADGFEAFVRLLVEMGVNLVKLATGQALKEPAAGG